MIGQLTGLDFVFYQITLNRQYTAGIRSNMTIERTHDSGGKNLVIIDISDAELSQGHKI